MKIGILGYGNLGRGVECAIKQNPDMELAAVFTRRAPETVSILTEGAAVCSVDDVEQWKDKIDVMILCGGSATDLPEQTPKYAKMFNVVDSFDTHARIPEHFENVDKSAKESGLINIFKMLWDSCVCIKTVYDIKHLCIFWCLLRQIRSTSAAENHNINLILPLLYIINRTNGCSLCQNGYCLRRTSRKYRSKLHIRILLNCTFHASSKVTIS